MCQVLSDTRQVQKEINQLSGKLERIFVVTEEQIYKVDKQEYCVLFCKVPFTRMLKKMKLEEQHTSILPVYVRCVVCV